MQEQLRQAASSVAEEGSFLRDLPLSPLRFRGNIWINAVRLRYDALTYRWQSWITGFNSETQLDLLQDWFGDVDPKKYVAILIGSWVLIMIPVAASLLLRRRVHPRPAAERYYLRFCRRLAERGVRREAGESPDAFAERASAALPEQREDIYRITGLYMQLAYLPVGADSYQQLLRQLKTAASPWSRLGFEGR